LNREVPRRPLLAPWYRLVEDGDRLLLEHARSVVVLEGAAVRALLPTLLPLLDGSRTADEVATELGEPAGPAIDRALELLAAHGLLVEGPRPAEGEPPAAAAVAAEYGLSLSAAATRLRSARVGVVGGSAVGAAVARLLHASGVGGVRQLDWGEGAEVDIAVAAPAGQEARALSGWNALAIEQGLRWLPLRPYDGQSLTVGPLVVPGESCCYECLLLRLEGHVEYGRDLRRIEESPVQAVAGAPLDAMAAGLASQLVLGWLGGCDTRLPGLLHVLETRPSPALAAHRVLRVPRCPACSPAERIATSLPWHEAEAA
jgi:bacteriocin biosynthesis cyclodehydratase domain-containing protein